MTTVSIAPTPSQWASAALHLERSSDWRYVRIDGTRYVVLASGNSGHVYQVRADAAGCGCCFYQRTGRPCSHMVALELDALQAELSEAQPAPATFGTCTATACTAPAIGKSRRCGPCLDSLIGQLAS